MKDLYIHKKVKNRNSLPFHLVRLDGTNYLLCLGSSDTVSFLRPFARRDFKTFLPLAVDILSLKPCLFLLFLFDG